MAGRRIADDDLALDWIYRTGAVSAGPLDLGVFNRKAHVVGAGEALGWTALWVAVALLFNVAVYHIYEHHWLGVGLEIGHALSGKQAALQFFTGYLIEKSLSLDNIFVIALIFSYFSVPLKHQHRLLFWGVLGALVLHGVMIIAGTALINRFTWMVYVFGGLLLVTEFIWARRLLLRVKRDARRLGKASLETLGRAGGPEAGADGGTGRGGGENG